MSYEDQEYHRRRSEIELEHAVLADQPESAVAHLELARMHHARRRIIAEKGLSALAEHHGGRMFRTDKEA